MYTLEKDKTYREPSKQSLDMLLADLQVLKHSTLDSSKGLNNIKKCEQLKKLFVLAGYGKLYENDYSICEYSVAADFNNTLEACKQAIYRQLKEYN